MNQIPDLLVSTHDGEMFEIPGIKMAVMAWNRPIVPICQDLIELPFGSSLFRLPGRTPIGYDPKKNSFVEIPQFEGIPVDAVSAFMPPAYLRLSSTAYVATTNSSRLPLYAYCAVGWQNDKLFSTGHRVDSWIQHDPKLFDCKEIERRSRDLEKKHKKNRLINHLIQNCVRKYGCAGAKNFVMNRWECPLPVSQHCNASCLGCISKQPLSSNVSASQHRLNFTPTVDELVETAVPFLETAEKPVASFGQGCEGDPLLEHELIEQTIIEIRKRTSRGIINVNTNGGLTVAVEKLCSAGLDSIRISLNSCQENFYTAYYKPRGYTFDNVRESIKIMRSNNRFVSINYLVFPGFTDTETEFAALHSLIESTKINMIQTRNLNIDPSWYIESMSSAGEISTDIMGMKVWLERVRKSFPDMMIGYFNPYLDAAAS